MPLAACLSKTTGAVLEIGVGDWSTPFLIRYCLASDRTLVCIEDKPEWASKYGIIVSNYDVALPKFARQAWSVVLVDHWPPKRKLNDASLFRKTAEYVLVHDAGKMLRRFRSNLPVRWPYRVEHDTIIFKSGVAA